MRQLLYLLAMFQCTRKTS